MPTTRAHPSTLRPRPLGAGVALASLLSVGAVMPVAAAEPYASGRVYAELGLGAGAVAVGPLDFYPGFGTAAVGAFLFPGIALELFADAGVREGTDEGFQLELESAYGAGLRFESPPVEGLAGYIVLGYTEYRLRQDLDNDRGRTEDVVEDFTGARISVGLVQRLRRVPALSLAGEYRKYYVDDGLDVDALVFSLRLSAP